jgi:hypothetical protein
VVVVTVEKRSYAISKEAIAFCERSPPGPGGWPGKLFFVLPGVVFSQEVVSEVAFERADDRMDVVRLVLGVVELHEESGALDAVVGAA